ncbi:MAG: GAF domain-containing protein [Chloroflexi bacterium]|nr:GAF domain-containing protein [Chloroflexota bacterium]
MGSFVVSPEIRAVLNDRDRLLVLRDLALIDADQEPVFDRLTRLASTIVGAPISVMTMVGDEYQFFKSAYGVGELRSTALSHSFCKHVVADNAPLVIDDAREHPVLYDNGAVADLGVIGYLGFPLNIASGKTLGSLCVVDVAPRHWDAAEIEIIRELAEMVKEEIELRALVHRGAVSPEQLDDLHTTIFAFADSIDVTAPKAQIAAQIRAERQRLFSVA